MIALDVRFEMTVNGVVEEIIDGDVGTAILEPELGEPRGGKLNINRAIGCDGKVKYIPEAAMLKTAFKGN